MNKKKVLSAIICLSLILNVVLGIMLYRQSTRYDFLKQQADQTFQAHFSLLTSHLTTACPEDESGYTMWVQKVEFLSNQCLDTFNLSSYEENHTLQDIILLLRSIALTWEEYPVGLIPHELATELMELSYRLTDDEELLTKVYEALYQLYKDDAVLCKDEEGNYYALSADGRTFLYYYPGNEDSSYTVPEGVETVDKNAFRDASHLKELRFSSTVRTVENGAFESLSVERIVIPATVEQITYDFVNCPNLKELVCEAPITDFNLIGCPALKHLILPQTITTLGVFCFEGCSAIAEIRTAGQNDVSDAALEAACSGKVIYLPEGITALSITQILGMGADGIYVPASVTELDLRGTGSWGRHLTVSVASTTSVLTDGDDYHTLLIRE